jgi:hypothetical protein
VYGQIADKLKKILAGTKEDDTTADQKRLKGPHL